MRSRTKQITASYLSKREQQIMELLYQRDRLTAAEITELLPGDASNSTVRTLLRILEQKGKVRHVLEAGRYVYSPVGSQHALGRAALLNIARTFFQGSISDVVVALLSEDGGHLSEEEL